MRCSPVAGKSSVAMFSPGSRGEAPAPDDRPMSHRSLRLRLIHTADWQIGKVFRLVDDATEGVPQAARVEAISTLGRLALERAAPTVLVAGDIY